MSRFTIKQHDNQFRGKSQFQTPFNKKIILARHEIKATNLEEKKLKSKSINNIETRSPTL